MPAAGQFLLIGLSGLIFAMPCEGALGGNSELAASFLNTERTLQGKIARRVATSMAVGFPVSFAREGSPQRRRRETS